MPLVVQPGIALSVRSFDHGSHQATALHPADVHIFLLEGCRPNQNLDHLISTLSTDESERAARFRFDEDRLQYVQTRGSLRFLLGSYLSIPPREIVFSYSEHGKPSLGEKSGRDLNFNVSHTKGMAVLGFCRGRRIGIDIERVRTDFQTTEVAERFFSAAEKAALRKLPIERRHQAFFRIWTRKEAYIKAIGEGLSHPLHQFDVSLDETARLIETRPNAAEARRWRLENIVVPSSFAAAVAVETAGEGEN